MTTTVELPPGPFKSKDVSLAVGIKAATVSTWGERGAFATFDFPSAGKGRKRYFSRLDTLSLALLGQCNRAGLSMMEMPEEQLRQWASDWVKELGATNRVTHLYVLYFGTPGAPNDAVRIMRNGTEVGADVPDRGPPRLTITFDLDAIFLPVLAALSQAD